MAFDFFTLVSDVMNEASHCDSHGKLPVRIIALHQPRRNLTKNKNSGEGSSRVAVILVRTGGMSTRVRTFYISHCTFPFINQLKKKKRPRHVLIACSYQSCDLHRNAVSYHYLQASTVYTREATQQIFIVVHRDEMKTYSSFAFSLATVLSLDDCTVISQLFRNC